MISIQTSISCLGQTGNRPSKRKTADSLGDFVDDKNNDRHDVRIRSSNDTFKH